jgi:ElaB/YqjD/DUF883 family membrane-anchored ribosome-binding protein
MVQDQNETTAATAYGRLKGDMDCVREDLKKLGDDFASLVKHGLRSGKSAGAKLGGRLKNAPAELGNRVTDAIETRPLAVIGTAFAAGILAGMLLKRRH